MAWYVKNHEALNLESICKATVVGGGSSWEVRIHTREGWYVVDSTHPSEMMARYRLSSMGVLAVKIPNTRGIWASADQNLFVFYGGCSMLAVAQAASGWSVIAMPKGEPSLANALIVKTGSEQECKDYLTGIYSYWS